jgi:hypothetical protein
MRTRQPCKNPNCHGGKELVTILLDTPVSLFVRAVLNPMRELRAISVPAWCRVCHPIPRARWEESVRQSRKNHPTKVVS